MKKTNAKKAKPYRGRNWLAVSAHFMTGAGPHGSGGKKLKYSRKKKHKANSWK